MLLTLHRRFPDEDHWEVDPEPFGTLLVEDKEVKLEMADTPIKNQIRRVIERPITYIGGFSDGFEEAFIRTVDKDSVEYVDALSCELRRLGIEARKRYPAAV